MCPLSLTARADLALLSNILTQQTASLPSDLQLFIQSALQENTGLVVSRQVVAEYVKAIGGAAIQDEDTRKVVIQASLDALQPRLVTYEEQVSPEEQPHNV